MSRRRTESSHATPAAIETLEPRLMLDAAPVINEIMYHPQEDYLPLEYLEIHNAGDRAQDLSGWQVDGVGFAFPQGASIEAGGYLVLAEDASAFANFYGQAPDYEYNMDLPDGSRTGHQLSNSGEHLRLIDDAGIVADDVDYRDDGNWSPLADGQGHALERRNPELPGDDFNNWAASVDTDGWRQAQFVGTWPSGPGTAAIYMDSAGDFYIDDVSLKVHRHTESVFRFRDELIDNIGFESGMFDWSATGNHSGSSVVSHTAHTGANSLHVVATGAGDQSANRIYQTNVPYESYVDSSDTFIFDFYYRPGESGSGGVVRLVGESGMIAEFDLGPGARIHPGTPNDVTAANLGPRITDVDLPDQPQPNTAFDIEADLADSDGVASAVLTYIVGFGSEVNVPMTRVGGDAGDGRWRATIPGQDAGEMIRYRIAATDSAGAVSTRPRPDDTADWDGTVVADPSIHTKLDAYHWFMTDADFNEMRNFPRSTEYMWPAWFYYDGTFYDNVKVRKRGQSAIQFQNAKPNYKVKFPQGHEFEPSFIDVEDDEINLQGEYLNADSLRQRISYDSLARGGAYVSAANHVRIQRNGEFFGLYTHVEHVDGDMLERNGLDPDGALYKAKDRGHLYNSQDFSYLEKKTRQWEDKSDLQDMVWAINNLNGETLENYIFDHFDVAALVNYKAHMTLSANADFHFKNYYLYQDTEGDGRWLVLPWDLDLNWGHHSLNLQDPNVDVDVHDGRHWYTHPLFVDSEHQFSGYNEIWDFLSDIDSIRTMYFRRLRSILDDQLGPPGEHDDKFIRQRLMEIVEEIDPSDWPYGQTDLELDRATNSPHTNYYGGDFDLAIYGSANKEGWLNYIIPNRSYHLYVTHGTESTDPKVVLPGEQAEAPPVVITEIMYNPESTGPYDDPSQRAYIELYNPNTTSVDMSDWEIEGVDFSFTPGTVMLPGQRMLVVKNEPAFRAAYKAAHGLGPNDATGLYVAGEFDGNLDPDGENLELVDADGNTIDQVRYDAAAPWPAAANGGGRSLEVIDVGADNSRPGAWTVSVDVGGTPGEGGSLSSPMAESPDITPSSSFEDTAVPFFSTWSYFKGTTAPDAAWNQAGYDDSAWLSGTQAIGYDTKGELVIGAELADMQNNYATVYTRHEFSLLGGMESAVTGLSLEAQVDDGIAVYVNGHLAGQFNMPAQPWTHQTFAVDALDGAEEQVTRVIDLSSAIPYLNGGTDANVLAIELHNRSYDSSDAILQARLDVEFTLGNNDLVINEVQPGTGGAGFVEIYNRADQAINLNGYYLTDTSSDLDKYAITWNRFVQPGGVASIPFSMLPGLETGDPVTLYLVNPDGSSVSSAVSTDAGGPGASFGRFADGSDTWYYFTVATPGAGNTLSQAPAIPSVYLNEMLPVNGSINTDSFGQYDPWVELYNPSASPVDIGGLYLTTDYGQYEQWAIPAGTTLEPGARKLIWLDGQNTVTAGGEIHAGFAVAPGDSLGLYTAAGTLVDYLNPGTLSADNAYGHYPEATGVKRAFTTVTPEAPNNNAIVTPLIVSEIMYNPAGGSDYEFLELLNRGDSAIDLAGVEIFGGIEYEFGPTAGLLQPGERVVVARDRTPFQIAYPGVTNLADGDYSGKLSNGGEDITLRLPWLAGLTPSMEYGDGWGWAIAADGAGHSLVFANTAGDTDHGPNWRASAYMGGSPGQADPALEDSVVINEAMAHTDLNDPSYPQHDSNDWIELYNPTDASIDISGWFLSDDDGDLQKWAIPAGTILPAGGRIVFDEITGFHVDPNSGGFGLDKSGDTIFLSRLDGAATDLVADAVQFKGQESDRSFARIADGADHWVLAHPSRNLTNTGKAADVVINETMYNPADDADIASLEFVELYNPTAHVIELFNAEGSWRLNGGVDFDFAPTQTLSPGEYLVVVGFDPADTVALDAFRVRYGIGAEVTVVGPYLGKLSNGGERVTLERPEAPDVIGEDTPWVVVDEVIYSDATPWPDAADGDGLTLERIDTGAAGTDPANWAAVSAGTPGSANVQPVTIGGELWDDMDGDAVRDAGEGSLVGRTIFIDVNESGSHDEGEPTVVTGSDGRYLFTHLAPGAWILRQVLPTDWSQTMPGGGAGQTVTLASGGSDLAVDFASRYLSTVPGDFDNNGAVNGLDIPGFKSALADPDAWSQANGRDAHLLGDFDDNGVMNGLDIPGFKAALSSGVAATGGEPVAASQASADEPDAVERPVVVAASSPEAVEPASDDTRLALWRCWSAWQAFNRSRTRWVDGPSGESSQGESADESGTAPTTESLTPDGTVWKLFQ